jgi:hypothetical protein
MIGEASLGADEAARLQSLGLAVIRNEAAAVAALAERIDGNFARACAYMLACEGRIVVTGMGKSGHIGGKIAATLASTGSPAFFVHPGEASHGDLGMITSQGRGAGPVQLRGDQRAAHHRAPHQAARGAPHRPHRQSPLHPGAGGGRASGRERGPGGLPPQSGPHLQHHRGAGDGRCPGHRPAGGAGLHRAGFRPLPSGGQPGAAVVAAHRGYHAQRRGHPAGDGRMPPCGTP